MSRSADARPVASDELVRALVATTPGGIVRVLPDGRIVDANAQACQMLGLRQDDITRTFVSDFDLRVVDERGQLVPVADYPVAITLATGRPAGPLTLGVQRSDGSVSWAVYHSVPLHDAEGLLDSALVTLLDITDRMRVESELRQSEERWRSLVENLPDFVITLDKHGMLRTINRTVSTMEPNDAIGRHFSEFMPPESAEIHAEQLSRVLTTGETMTFELLGHGPGRSPEWYETMLAP
ncbi:MAG TPA: PAS domain-containing protein, partial [Nannocystaceae bacterium]|nr:PAS domain-containing protein [Nannocystaceae bacterium]